jgi:hypothetical protein
MYRMPGAFDLIGTVLQGLRQAGRQDRGEEHDGAGTRGARQEGFACCGEEANS